MLCPHCKVKEYEKGTGKKKNVVLYKSEDYDGHRRLHKFCKQCGRTYTSTESIDRIEN